jgi:4-alpha-glucanotransferase
MKTIKDALADPHGHGLASARDKAWAEVRQIATWAGFEVPEIVPFVRVHEKLLAALFRTNSWIAICMITDVFGTTQRFNVPGAVSAENWTCRLDSPAAQWDADAALVRHLRRVRELIRATDRAAK